ncbi:MAG: polyprenyl synthetase family protein [Paludibacter sp.]|nr:polyprenyl synthetase family protein [Paludibacter sp.]
MKTFQDILTIVNSSLVQMSWNKDPIGLYAPVEYILGLGGKRIRPALTLMACDLFCNDLNPAIKPALGLELFHNFTLLHDDIMDKADIRRGRPTVHKQWNENTAILSGDVMQIVAYQLISEAPAHNLKQVLDIFSRTAIEICEGQQYDMEFESRDNVQPEEYLEMIRLKTAVLLGCALYTGAVIGGAQENDAQNLYEFGINIGLAFQLKDDLLDVYGNVASFGKKVGGDILCNKKTYLLIQAINLAEGKVKSELNHWMSQPDSDPESKVCGVTSIYNQLGAKKICEDTMSVYYEKAIAFLDKVSVDLYKKQELRNLAENLMFRND